MTDQAAYSSPPLNRALRKCNSLAARDALAWLSQNGGALLYQPTLKIDKACVGISWSLLDDRLSLLFFGRGRVGVEVIGCRRGLFCHACRLPDDGPQVREAVKRVQSIIQRWEMRQARRQHLDDVRAGKAKAWSM